MAGFGGGFLAGGAAQGFTQQMSEQNLAQFRQDELKLQQQSQQNQQKREQFQQIDATFKQVFDHLTEHVTQAKTVGQDINQISKDIAPLLPAAEKLWTSSGRDPAVFKAMVASTLAMPNPADVKSKMTAAGESPLKREEMQATIESRRATTEKTRAQAGQIAQGTFDDEAIDLKSNQALAGDVQGATANVGRGNQGSNNLVKIWNEVARKAKEQGITGEQLANINQQFRAVGNALSAGARTAATREANLGIILETVKTAAPGAIAASDAIPRGNWVRINKLVQMAESEISDPALKTFRQKNLQLAELWAKSMNPTGVMRNEDRELALGILSTADSNQTYKTAVNSLIQSIGMEENAAHTFLEKRGLGSVLKRNSKSLGGGENKPTHTFNPDTGELE